MEFTELIAWFEEAPADVARLRALGSSLGLELTRRRIDHLGRTMTALAAAAARPFTTFVRAGRSASTAAPVKPSATVGHDAQPARRIHSRGECSPW